MGIKSPSVLEDKLLIASDKNWLAQPQQPVDVQMLESTGKSYSEDEMIAKVKETYAVANAIAGATNQTEWLYQRLVDAVLTQLTYDQHMLVMVGDAFEQSWDKMSCQHCPYKSEKKL